MSLKEFAEALPDYAKDIRLNLELDLSDQLLGDQRNTGCCSPARTAPATGRWSRRRRPSARASSAPRRPMRRAARRR